MWTITDVITNNALNFGEREALVAGASRLSFAELDARATAAAGAFQSIGIEKGDRVAIMGRNTLPWVVAAMGVLRAGGILVPINHKLMAPEVHFILEHCEAKVVVFEAALAGVIGQIQLSAKKYAIDGDAPGFEQFETMLNERPSFRAVPLASTDAAEILYTSGTTGKPKGCVHSHETVLLAGIATNLTYFLGPTDRTLIAMPVWHCFPLNNLLIGSFYVGASVVLLPEYHPLEFLKTIQAERCTMFFGAPIAYILPVKAIHHFDAFDLSSVRVWLYGGGPIDPATARMLMQRYKTGGFFQVFGMTESGPTGLALYPHEQEAKAGSIGRHAVSGCMVKIMKNDNEAAGPGDIGEIWMKCQSMMLNYYRDPEATQSAFRDGWYLTGDIARIDADGYLFIVDRANDMIITGGENVYSKEVEDVLSSYPGIGEVAVIGKPNREWGESVVAVIAGSAQIDENAIREFCAARLAKYKIPREFKLVEALPRTPTGKVMKFKLRQAMNS